MPGINKNRSFIWFIIPGLIIAGLIIIFLNPRNSFRSEAASVQLRHPEHINRIIISGKYDSILLLKGDSLWRVSGSDPANQLAVENILFAASRLSITSILSDKERDTGWNKTSIAYMRNERVVQQYDFYFDGKRYLLHFPETENLYIVALSGYEELELERVFSPISGHYQVRQLIDLLPGEISEVTVYIPGKSHFAFYQDSSGEVECIDLMENKVVSNDSLAELSVRLFLSYFTDIRYTEQYKESDARTLRAGMNDRMLGLLKVESRSGDRYSMEVYPLINHIKGEPELFEALVIFNEQPDVLIVNYIYLDVLLRGLEHYFRNES